MTLSLTQVLAMIAQAKVNDFFRAQFELHDRTGRKGDCDGGGAFTRAQPRLHTVRMPVRTQGRQPSGRNRTPERRTAEDGGVSTAAGWTMIDQTQARSRFAALDCFAVARKDGDVCVPT